MKQKLGYKSGDVFSVRREGGAHIGLCYVLAVGRRGIAIGDFFRNHGGADIRTIAQSSADFRAIFGDLDIIKGRWLPVGDLELPEDARRGKFLFKRESLFGDRYITTYDCHVELVEETRVSGSDVIRLADDDVLGAGVVISMLERIDETRRGEP